jgi:DNA-binding MurR/RpiR family transcriptional regulator
MDFLMMTLLDPALECLLQSEVDGSICSMSLASLIDDHRDQLTKAERRVADGVLTDPQAVAFGTLASVAGAFGTSGTTIIRLAVKLGLDGFGDLQAVAQEDLAAQLRPARQRIREPAPGDLIARTLAFELDNLQDTFSRVDRASFAEAAKRVAECRGRVLIIAAECASGVGSLLSDQLAMLRDGVVQVAGNDVHVGKLLASAGPDDTALVIDERRYDRWVLRALKLVADAGVYVISFSDSPLSPLAEAAAAAFTVSARGPGPYDSQVAALALGYALVAAVAAELAVPAADRLDRLEENWRSLDAIDRTS